MTSKDRQSSIAFSYGAGRHFETETRTKYVDHGRMSDEDLKAFDRNKKYLRGHHFDFGVAEAEYDSSQKISFPEHKNAEKTKPITQSRDSSFQFGYEQNVADHYESTNRRDLCKPQTIDGSMLTGPEVEEQPPQKHGISFGTDENVLESTYQQQCRASQANDGRDIAADLAQANLRSKELRKTNFLVGTNTDANITCSQEAFNFKGFEPPAFAANNDVRKNHISLGTDTAKYTSTMGVDFGNVDKVIEACKNPRRLAASEKAELRSHHFTLGNDPRELTSLSQQTFCGYDNDPEAKEDARKLHADIADVRKRMRKSNVDLGTDGIDSYMSTTKDSYEPKDLKAAKQDKVEPDRQTHITFGYDTEECKNARSVSMIHEDMAKGVSGTHYEDIEVVKGSRETSICIGSDATVTRSTAQDSYVGYGKTESAAMDKEVLKDLRATHYTLGTDAKGYKGIQSAMQEQMQYRQPAIIEKPVRKEEDVRRANISFGTTEGEYVSTHQDSFLWPVK